jgi:hypothetical protein
MFLALKRQSDRVSGPPASPVCRDGVIAWASLSPSLIMHPRGRHEFAPDSSLEEAVVSEPVSGVQFPGYWEKYRESHFDLDTSAFNLSLNQTLTTEIP